MYKGLNPRDRERQRKSRLAKANTLDHILRIADNSISQKEKDQRFQVAMELIEKSKKYGLTPSKSMDEIRKLSFTDLNKFISTLRNRITHVGKIG